MFDVMFDMTALRAAAPSRHAARLPASTNQFAAYFAAAGKKPQPPLR
jgi:hypothetical protein